jgi:hypothetical protein
VIVPSEARQADRAMALLALACGGAVLWLGRGLTFFWDEWEFISARSLGDVESWLRPHNEHWSTIPIVAYRLLVETIGLGSYVPYHLLLVALHVLAAIATYVLVRRQTFPIVALGAGAVALLFGSGFENIFWAFQIGFVASTAATLLALILLDGQPTRGRAVSILALLLVALASSGLGIAGSVAVSTEMVTSRGWRQHLWVPAAALLAFAAWFFTYGRAGLGVQGNPLLWSAVLHVPMAIVIGLASGAGAIVGVGPVAGIAVVLAMAAYVAKRSVERALPSRTICCLIGVATLYVLVGISRTADPVASASAPRTTYFSGLLLLVALAPLVGRPSLPSVPTVRRVVVATSGAVVALSLAWNLTLLIGGRSLFSDRADITRALILVSGDPRATGLSGDAQHFAVVPPRPVLLGAIARYGSPLTDALVTVAPPSARAIAKARAYLLDAGPIPVPGP